MTHDSVETCRSVINCEIIVHVLVNIQNKKKYYLWFCTLVMTPDS
jgi:hypothetical protein